MYAPFKFKKKNKRGTVHLIIDFLAEYLAVYVI